MFWEGEAPAEPKFLRARVYPVPDGKMSARFETAPYKNLDLWLTGKFALPQTSNFRASFTDLTGMGIRHKLSVEVKGNGVRASRLGFGGT